MPTAPPPHHGRPGEGVLRDRGTPTRSKRHPSPRHSGDHPSAGHFPYAVVAPISKVEISRTVHRYADRVIELCARGRASIPRVTGTAIARHSGDYPICDSHFPDAAVVVIGIIEVSETVHRYSFRSGQFRA